jgi:adenylate cyclase
MKTLIARFIPRKVGAGAIGTLLTFGLLLMYLVGNPLVDVLELKTYDMRLRAAGPRVTPPEVVIAAVDEKSLNRVGRWPWSRRTMSRLVEKLDRVGARVIAFDVLFSEAENNRLLDEIVRLEAEGGFSAANSPYARLRQTIAADESLGRSIATSGRVVLSMMFLMTEDETGHVRERDAERAFKSVESQAIGVIRDSGGGQLDFPMPEPRGLIANLPELQAAARYSGHINTYPDSDGTLRWAPLVMRYHGRYFPSGDLQAARAFLGAGDIVLHTAAYGITGISLGERFIPTDEYGRALVHYFGPEKTIHTISASDILDGTADAAALRDKIVLVGATAKGIGDIRVTPYGPAFPGAEIRASVIQNLIANDFIRRPGWMFLVDVVVLLALGALLTTALPRLGIRHGALLAMGLLTVYLGAAVVLLDRAHIWLSVVYPSILILVLFMQGTLVTYFVTETEKRQIKSAFQHYVPSKVVDEISNDITKLRLGGEKRELTVLFSDIRGFTSVAETIAPEELVKLLNIYLTQMTDNVFAHDGLLDKYIGDAIMAVYGAPIFRPDHAKLACLTALDMMAALRELQAQWRREGRPVLDIGIGINTGPMIVGNMGSQTRFDYTVIGDAVNLGSRIEGMNKIYGTHILVSEFTYLQVKDDFPNLREIDVAPVRGRHEQVRLYELIPAGAFANLDWLGDFKGAYGRFHAGHIAEAAAGFQALAATVHDPVSEYYVRRCQNPR